MPRLNPPPGWPPVPPGWTPPANWQPDPSWPAPPPGWQLWMEDGPVAAAGPAAAAVSVARAPASAAAVSSYWAIGGGAAIVIGAWLPFISVSAADLGLGDFKMPTSLQLTSALFGVILAALGFGLRKNPGYGTALLVLSVLGLIGYAGFTLFGLVGVSIFHFSPSIGLILTILGCIAVLAGANRSKKTT